jgi:HAD superfamily hydrolase (TIGR01509 family)
MTPAAVLFDCDGVIVDSEGPTLDLLIQDLAPRGLHLTRHQLETDYLGGTIETVAARIRAGGTDLPPDWVTRFYDRMYALLAQGTPLIPGIIAVFDALDAARIPYAVGSNGTPEKMRITLGQHGLLPRFRATLSGQAIGNPKPAPDLYLATAAACGADPALCVVIEDSPSGARAALAAGIPCLGFAAHGPGTPPAKGLAALGIPLFHHMADLPRLLGL